MLSSPLRTRPLRNAAALICALFVAACATIEIDLPSVSDVPTNERLPGKIIWHDLLTHDVKGSQKFYGSLFGWEFESIGSESGFGSDSVYTLIRHDGRLIGGMIDTVALNGKDDISQWVVVMSVDDVDAAAARFAADGGEVITPPSDLQRRGRLAVVRDAEGALLALLQTKDGDPVDGDPVVDEFLWDELWTSDIDDATEFYESVTGLQADEWEVDQNEGPKAAYRLLKSGETPRVGIMPNPLEELGPVWVSYLRVEDPADIAANVEALGGYVIVEAQARSLGGEVAFIAGPSGAGIALQTWPLEQKD
jgi:predicted enzyme related to lactoylglutathione lyase